MEIGIRTLHATYIVLIFPCKNKNQLNQIMLDLNDLLRSLVPSQGCQLNQIMLDFYEDGTTGNATSGTSAESNYVRLLD